LVWFVVWVALTGVVAFSPDLLEPLGGFASILLIVLPTLPVAPALLFEAIIPPRYVEGAIEGMRFVTHQDRTTLHLDVAGQSFRMNPSLIEGLGLGQGARVRLIASGFLRKVRRIARSG